MAATDDYASYEIPPGGPCRHAAAVTPSDSTPLADVSRYLYVGGAGNLSLIMQDGATVAINGVTAGSLLPVAASQVNATGTTATNITALW